MCDSAGGSWNLGTSCIDERHVECTIISPPSQVGKRTSQQASCIETDELGSLWNGLFVGMGRWGVIWAELVGGSIALPRCLDQAAVELILGLSRWACARALTRASTKFVRADGSQNEKL